MPSSGMLRRVALVGTDVSEERIANITLIMEAVRSSETSVPTRVTRPDIPEDDILHSHRRETPKSYSTSLNELKRRCW
jgi:hypothetical protein